ncbi:hypothetical protein DRO54_03005 [Candidatus Bathyarchaeota archaeon]|nr:MAG: hypothetical protein DRO54_03005 [Candidatus Bathyarchaeota archaeon]
MEFEADLREIVEALKDYVEKGWSPVNIQLREEPKLLEAPDESKIKPLKKTEAKNIKFLAVDCSTRTLKRAHNWGIYLFRVSCVLVQNREVKWSYEEKMQFVPGDLRTRSVLLKRLRLDLESKTALKNLASLSKGDYLLLDGASYFGEKKGFYILLYEKCKNESIRLLAVSKQSPMLHDDKGRDLAATVYAMAKHPIWIYYPVEKADKSKHLYGDICLVKLCADSPRVFRCDIMDYLTEDFEASEIISPLTSISEDPRCLGYPIALWLAHDFSGISNSKLLFYHDQLERTFKEAGISERIRREELSCNFPDELHGLKYPFEKELIEYV